MVADLSAAPGATSSLAGFQKIYPYSHPLITIMKTSTVIGVQFPTPSDLTKIFKKHSLGCQRTRIPLGSFGLPSIK